MVNLYKLKKELLATEVFDVFKRNIKDFKPTQTKYGKFKNKKRKNKIHNHFTRKMDYRTYMKSPLWRERRRNYFAIYKKKCASCGGKRKIGLHHMSYERLGHELDGDLVALCWCCHEKYHELHGVDKDSVKATTQFIEEQLQSEEFYQIAKNL